MLSAPVAIVPPTVRRLVSPETAQRRLGLPDAELETLTEQLDEASGLVTRFLGYETAYTTWEETFADVGTDRLYLGARPAWAVSAVTDRSGTIWDTNTYRLLRGPYGESALLRGGTWSLNGNGRYWNGAGWSGTAPLSLIEGGTGAIVVPDWTVRYTAGWWLEEMGPTPPAGVEPFPVELRRDFLALLRWLREAETMNPMVSRMTNEGATFEFLRHKDQDLDPLTSIPTQFLTSFSKYRRAM